MDRGCFYRNTNLPMLAAMDASRSRRRYQGWQPWTNLDRGCSRNRMSLRWQGPVDRMQVGMDGIAVCAWMLRSSDALGHRRYYGLGMDVLVIGCLGRRIGASSQAPHEPGAKGLAAQLQQLHTTVLSWQRWMLLEPDALGNEHY